MPALRGATAAPRAVRQRSIAVVSVRAAVVAELVRAGVSVALPSGVLSCPFVAI